MYFIDNKNYIEKKPKGSYKWENKQYLVYDGYKVVKDIKGQLRSLIVMRYGRVEYKINDYVYSLPNCGCLTCFNCLSHTMDYYDTRHSKDDIKIFKCEYSKYVMQTQRCVYIPSGIRKIYLKELPVGTELADAIKLIEEYIPVNYSS